MFSLGGIISLLRSFVAALVSEAEKVKIVVVVGR
jgi:hypothetical protein